MELDQQRTVNAANEIIGIDQGQGQPGWITPEFDAAGNMILGLRADAPGTAQFYVHDVWNRLAKVFADTDENGEFDEEEDELLAEYRYDGRGRRVEKILTEASGEPGSVAYYHNHAWQVLEERVFDDEQELERVYQNIWSPWYIDALILRDACDPATGAMLPAERLFYLADANYNVTGVVRENPASPGEWHVVERYVYDPYGRVAVLNGDPAGDPDGLAAPELYPAWSADPDGRSDLANTTLYTGRELDAESGLMYYRARYYEVLLSTFTTRDPMGYAAGDVNLYRYVGNAPTNRVDPSGEAWWNLWLCDLSAALGERFGTALTNYRYADADLKRNARLRELHIKYPDIYGQRGVNPVHSSVRGCNFAIGAATDIAETGVYLQSASAGMATPQGSCRLPATSSSRPAPSPPPSTRPPAQRAAPGAFAEQMAPAEAARYRAYWESRPSNPVRFRDQAAPGTRIIRDPKMSTETGEVYMRESIYDQFGRRIGANEYTTHGRADHTLPHYHTRNPITGQREGPFPGLHPETP